MLGPAGWGAPTEIRYSEPRRPWLTPFPHASRCRRCCPILRTYPVIKDSHLTRPLMINYLKEPEKPSLMIEEETTKRSKDEMVFVRVAQPTVGILYL